MPNNINVLIWMCKLLKNWLLEIGGYQVDRYPNSFLKTAEARLDKNNCYSIGYLSHVFIHVLRKCNS